MPVTIKGIFENGQVKLAEPAPTEEKVSVTITFPDEGNIVSEKSLEKNEIKFGSLAGKISVPENFDEEMDELKDYM
ncbi:MAG: hypothetical protein ABI863_12860 [Ginsengibacter sp.]